MKSKHSDLAISSLTDVFKDLYDFFFANNTYSLQDFADAIAQDEEDIINK